MGLKDIPVVGPGSQPAETDGAQLETIDMPRGASTYRTPLLPEPHPIRNMSAAMETMDWLQQALDAYRPENAPAVVDISGLDAQNRDVVNQILGEGEVSVQYRGEFSARMQEAVLAGVWRTFYLDGEGRPTRDLIEVADVPVLARLTGRSDARVVPNLSGVEAPPDVMNAMPILTELSGHVSCYRPGQAAHVINLTLLPLSPEDVAFLDEVLGTGPVGILSRGYGECRITSTAVPDVWWVRYYNATGRLILNTLEVVDIPIAACAAPEDLEASARRLRDLLEPYRPSGG
jgi:hydrogenase-1 operon protein HyaF